MTIHTCPMRTIGIGTEFTFTSPFTPTTTIALTLTATATRALGERAERSHPGGEPHRAPQAGEP